ncbi:MAG: hypothetical protein QM791_23750 [Ferruginibacter sp.]
MVALFGMLWVLSGCTVLKTKQTEEQTTTSKNSTDSTAVKKSESRELNENTWWREMVMRPGHNDTTTIIERSLQPIYNNGKDQVIYMREGGTSKSEAWHYNYDSANRAALDTMAAMLTKSQKTKETQVFNAWQILALCLGSVVVFFILSKLKISFK